MKICVPPVDASLLALPDDLLRAIIARLGVPLRGSVEGLAPALAPALALADTHPSLAGAIADALVNLSLTFSATSAPAQVGPVLAAAGCALRHLSLTGPHDIPRAALNALLATPACVRSLSLRRLPSLDDAAIASLLCNQPQLESVTIVALPGFGPAAVAALVALPRLSSLALEDLPNLPFASAAGAVRCAGGRLSHLSLQLRYPLARVVARNCGRLQELALAGDEEPAAVVAACAASGAHLRSARLAVRPLGERHVRAIVDVCPALDELYAPAVAPRVQADVVGHRLKRLDVYLGAVDTETIDRLVACCPHVAHLRVVGTGVDAPAHVRAVVQLVVALGRGLESLIVRDVAGLDDDAAREIGDAAGALTLLSIDGLDQVSAAGLEELVRANGKTLAHASIGAKCRLLTTVAIMRVLAKHCSALQAVSFPRWSIMKRTLSQPTLQRAYADFCNAAPNVSIVAG